MSRIKGKLLIILFLLLMVGLAPIFQKQVQADCRHVAGNKFKHEKSADTSCPIPWDTYAKCKYCNEWFLYHAARDHYPYQGEVAMVTCTTDGYYILKCSDCPAKEKYITEKALGHKWSAWTVSKEAACGVAGQEKRSCTNDGCRETQTRKTEALSHKWSSWKQTKAATCTAEGQEQRKCSLCSKTENKKIKATGHNWDKWAKTKAATCTADGQEQRKCSQCGKTENKKIKATGHKWGSWKVAQNASCGVEGKEQRSCSNSGCKEVEIRAIPARSHNWGNWSVSKKPFHGQPGEESRTCSICNKKENRPIEAEKPLAKAGDQGIIVLIVQHLLSEGGEYSGKTDGVMRDDLSAAIRVFEAAASLPQTGNIYPDTLQLLNDRYIASMESNLPSQGLLHSWESGLRTRLQTDEKYVSNKDGSHKKNATAIAVQYLLDETEMSLPLSANNQHSFPETTEVCLLHNNALTCGKCGYRTNLGWALKNALAGSGGSSMMTLLGELVYLNGTEDLGLGDIEKARWVDDMMSMTWEPKENAHHYHIVIEKDGETVYTGDQQDTFLHCIAWHTFGTGEYIWHIQALGEDGAYRSNDTAFAFHYDSYQMPEVSHLVCDHTRASWEFDWEGYRPEFHVMVISITPASEGESRVVLLEKTVDDDNMLFDFSDIYFRYRSFGVGTRLEIHVKTMDQDGRRADSEPVIYKMDYVRPDFLKTLVLVNVRQAPAQTSGRLGAYHPGDIVLCWDYIQGADGTYAVVDYEGETGYINRNFLAWFQPMFFEVPVDLGDGRVYWADVNVDGTLNWLKLRTHVKKTGHGLKGVLKADGTPLGDSEVLTPSSRLTAVWEFRSMLYVKVTFYDENNNKLMFTDPDTGSKVDHAIMYIGKGTSEKQPDEVKQVFQKAIQEGAFWSTTRDGKGLMVTENTRITRNMTELYLVTNTADDYTVGEIIYKGYSDVYRQPFTTQAHLNMVEKIGTLMKGDKIRILDRYNTGSTSQAFFDRLLEFDFYKIYHYRLQREGYIFALTLENAAGTAGHAVRFDADGGWCAIKLVQLNDDNRNMSLPEAAKDGCTFLGWFNEDGRQVTSYGNIKKDTTLKAGWKEDVNAIKLPGVVRPSEYFKSSYRDPKYYQVYLYSDQDCRKTIKQIYSGTMVTVIQEPNDHKPFSYRCILPNGTEGWIKADNISLDFEKVYLHNAAYKKDCFDEKPEIRDKFGGKGTFSYVGYDVSYVYIIGGKKSEYKAFEGTHYYYPVVWPADSDKKAGTVTGMDFYDSRFGWVPEVYLKSSNRTLYPQYTVTFNYRGGLGDTAMMFCEYRVRSLPQASFPGKQFSGWYTEPLGGVRVTVGTIIDKNMVLYAHWEDDMTKTYITALKDGGLEVMSLPGKGTRVGKIMPGEVVILLRHSGNWSEVVLTNGAHGYIKRQDYTEVKLIRLRTLDYAASYLTKTTNFKSKNLYRKIVDGEWVFMVEYDNKSGWATVLNTSVSSDGRARSAQDALLYVHGAFIVR